MWQDTWQSMSSTSGYKSFNLFFSTVTVTLHWRLELMAQTWCLNGPMKWNWFARKSKPGRFSLAKANPTGPSCRKWHRICLRKDLSSICSQQIIYKCVDELLKYLEEKFIIHVKADPNVTSKDLKSSLADSGIMCVRRKLNQHGFNAAHHQKNLLPTVGHGGGNIKIQTTLHYPKDHEFWGISWS